MFLCINKSNYDWIAKIYEEGIKTGNATFETQVPNFKKWDETHLKFGRVALTDQGEIKGWGALSLVSNRCVYGGVAETSIYIKSDSRGKGIGRLILHKLIEESEKNGIWTLQCSIMRENTASIALHKKCGFREIGYRERIGKLNGVWKDNIIMERRSKTIGV